MKRRSEGAASLCPGSVLGGRRQACPPLPFFRVHPQLYGLELSPRHPIFSPPVRAGYSLPRWQIKRLSPNPQHAVSSWLSEEKGTGHEVMFGVRGRGWQKGEWRVSLPGKGGILSSLGNAWKWRVGWNRGERVTELLGDTGERWDV